MPNPKMIAIWGGDNILSSFIELILAAREEWQVVRLTSKEDLDALLLESGDALPEIIIVHQECGDPADLPIHFMHDYPVFKVIMLNLKDNTMEVYNRQKFMVKQSSDVIFALESEPYSDLEDLAGSFR
jgi:hypothetical protein